MNIGDEEDESEGKGSASEYEGDKGFSGFQGLNTAFKFLKNASGKTHKTLAEYKLCLESCATYNFIFIKTFLDCIGDADEIMHGYCNAVVTIASKEG